MAIKYYMQKLIGVKGRLLREQPEPREPAGAKRRGGSIRARGKRPRNENQFPIYQKNDGFFVTKIPM
ncbi:hypothetical protein D1B33_12835 [Lysinibacillus yapensis]|uniref:Uncharacterized protein n=1 Tax=Ureibacillus yapensis TaxID=2304605 RepID=A0A396SKD0_9BACL|nr:hypothetical protein D1B33_12835 [Lysinibacillus yapensis]